ncbi:hypothetical protein GCM10011351_26980 [Paraliobacillus quinghaiensis]|uniref:Uncharacterized protein n=1 Tax=Paraliobacillus quinghaiensis TaxID=470815 RepID=A0A917WYB6_9BACI|nr:hypothetical protein [Paraliobacillus quinghaiensis]GGM39428.1 hypothetical protein GCM10011351_26980 [Paraliobacillus quinghaiensis]
MAQAGDYYEIVLKEAHLEWGSRGESRVNSPRHEEESYIQIPSREALKLEIQKGDIYQAVSSDGNFIGEVKASGSQGPNNAYAKQFQGYGNLRTIGHWLKTQLNAQPGDIVRVVFTSENEVTFNFIRQIHTSS